jgi:hypothetical protein
LRLFTALRVTEGTVLKEVLLLIKIVQFFGNYNGAASIAIDRTSGRPWFPWARKGTLRNLLIIASD